MQQVVLSWPEINSALTNTPVEIATEVGMSQRRLEQSKHARKSKAVLRKGCHCLSAISVRQTGTDPRRLIRFRPRCVRWLHHLKTEFGKRSSEMRNCELKTRNHSFNLWTKCGGRPRSPFVTLPVELIKTCPPTNRAHYVRLGFVETLFCS